MVQLGGKKMGVIGVGGFMDFAVRLYLVFFFFQAEDGIRDKLVTGVQTCALPISRFAACGSSWPRAWRRCSARCSTSAARSTKRRRRSQAPYVVPADRRYSRALTSRSEERRVGREGRRRWRRYQKITECHNSTHRA